MLKIVYAYEIYPEDIEGIEIAFAQCYFDYFILPYLIAFLKSIDVNQKKSLLHQIFLRCAFISTVPSRYRYLTVSVTIF